MQKSTETSIKNAEFVSNLAQYWLTPFSIFLAITIVGLPLLLLWLPIGHVFTRRYIANMSIELTDKKLIVRKGVFTRTENSVPLDKITDMALIQGPLMRFFKLHKLTVETAGQSDSGALLNLTGIVNAAEFRSMVLAQKEKLNQLEVPQIQDENNDTQVVSLLQEISDTLKRIEANSKNNAVT
ncbi:Membrane-flanked domain protein [Shewanella piezotolerans WP3]|uniref:Membrane-flanked domain protein n=1 Tax=Shewanella piezotolerans (strain WP3 / JCM 13877) TaxID=225849 RepID=B8CQT2_SHEPW|nr:PH domain-containing protein [Shewanella piezotolerans]ACJ30548.1 Membrane-flanked domain protein [Shewanella piezotolerans WP3]